jgi:hypothetical protein
MLIWNMLMLASVLVLTGLPAHAGYGNAGSR